MTQEEKKAIGLVELNSIARGFLTCDTMVKTANVNLLETLTICPGKYMIIIGGDVGAVKSSLEAGIHKAGEVLVDYSLIPNVHPDIFPAINAATKVEQIEALGIFETFTVASGIIAADLAIKTALVHLLELRLGTGIAGKSFFTLSGQVSDVRAAIEAGRQKIAKEGVYVASVVIPRPDPKLIQHIW